MPQMKVWIFSVDDSSMPLTSARTRACPRCPSAERAGDGPTEDPRCCMLPGVRWREPAGVRWDEPGEPGTTLGGTPGEEVAAATFPGVPGEAPWTGEFMLDMLVTLRVGGCGGFWWGGSR